jgi:hypothetical protein
MKIISLIMLLTISTTALAESKKCVELQKQYNKAVRTHSTARHRLVERLWVECGK